MQARLSTAAMLRHAALAVTLAVGPAEAPLAAQYISPGSVTRTSTVVPKETFDESLENARWKLGPLRLSPWLGLRDASVVSSDDQLTASGEDFTATIGAGLRGYLPTGKLIWTAHALPEYVWWQDEEGKRSFNGRYGLGLFGHFNRLRLELSQRRTEQQAFFSDELRELTSSRSDVSTFNLEVEVARRLVLYGLARRLDFSNEEGGSEVLALLDREEEVFALGLRYLSPRGWNVGLTFEDAATDFRQGARNLSNSGTGQLLDIGFTGSRFSLLLMLAMRDLEGDPGSDFGRFDDATGFFEVVWGLAPRIDLLTYARREQRFSVDAGNAFILYERQGGRLEIDLDRAGLGLVAEIGEDVFETVTGALGRRDDVTAFGADYRYTFRDRVTVSLQVLRTRYDADPAIFDREITTVSFGFELGALARKLQLGRPEGDW